MATTQKRPSKKKVDRPESAKAAPPERDVIEEIDALLADIDCMLEENAAQFVSMYVQKGGQ
jgi:ubiquitin-like protein Pup